MDQLPKIIQGGMGVAVSNWKLARTVALKNQMGVVSGTGIDTVMIRRLQDGDLDGSTRRALAQFHDQEISEKIMTDFYIENGKAKDKTYKRLPLHSLNLTVYQQQILAVSAYVEVFLAKEDHTGVVGINLLEKVQLPNLATMYGAMLADVDYVLMGAGIPREIPGALDLLSEYKEANLKIDVIKSTKDYRMTFNPELIFPNLKTKNLKRPKFLAIISSYTLASHLVKKSTGVVDGFIIEGFLAGGHNAPPRGPMTLDDIGSPIYSEKDVADLAAIATLGKPFWLAGAYGTPDKLKAAIEYGAAGIQVGTAFAFCEESGFAQSIKDKVIAKWGVENNSAELVFTDPLASPTGFPFKVAPMANTLSESRVYEERPRICDIGYLREFEELSSGDVVYRCKAEPIADYARKGGDVNNTVNRKCLCNALMSAVDLAQVQKNNYVEPVMITAGDDVVHLYRLVHPLKKSYSANDVLNFILS